MIVWITRIPRLFSDSQMLIGSDESHYTVAVKNNRITDYKIWGD